MDGFTWEPLPPRELSTSITLKERQQKQNMKLIAENIENRGNVDRSGTTLGSKDGCAGEFFEYLDHTADVQLHCWGNNMKHAFENMAPCMSNYMTDINKVTINPNLMILTEISGHDYQSLLYNFMQDILYKFSADGFCTVKVNIELFNTQTFSIKAILFGEVFDDKVHTSGTEIKAITYSNMQIHETLDRVDIFVIVDI